jgi:hypothetical protein
MIILVMMGGYDSTREGAKGELFMGIDPNLHSLFLLHINLLFIVECPLSQSLNSCKRVGVRSHIP